MADKKNKGPSKVEKAKEAGNRLRGTIEEVLTSDAEKFEHDDLQLLKFHGTYQQDDRDLRKQRRADGLGPAYSFMVRVAMPGGITTADQYLGLDAIADDDANGTLRITTRQGIQFHGIIKGDLKDSIARINEKLLTTLAACGDVERNVMACPAPLADKPHRIVRDIARKIARELQPASRAYHEIWLDGEKHLSAKPETEPLYGDTYLPRKFKIGIALNSDNSIDVYSYDLGFIAMVENDTLTGYNVVVGGGMGMTHRKPDTYAKLAEPLGFIEPDQIIETAKTVITIFRDLGNRSDRKHARIKYLIDDMGMDKFRDEFNTRAAFNLQPYRPHEPVPVHDYIGRHQQGDGKMFYGVFIQNGRIADFDDKKIKTALRTIAEKHAPGFVFTAHQNVLITNVTAKQCDDIEQLLHDHGITPGLELSQARRNSMACPALPTCGLALSESERVIADIITEIESELDTLGLRDEPISIRMTGCPNGCARPYTADIAFVGKGPDNYNVYVGGGMNGDRVVDLFADDIAQADFITTLRPLLKNWAKDRNNGESLSDYYHRVIGSTQTRIKVTGLEKTTIDAFSLKVLQ